MTIVYNKIDSLIEPFQRSLKNMSVSDMATPKPVSELTIKLRPSAVITHTVSEIEEETLGNRVIKLKKPL